MFFISGQTAFASQMVIIADVLNYIRIKFHFDLKYLKVKVFFPPELQ